MSRSPIRDLAVTIVGALADAGTDRLFGMPGGGVNLELVGAASDAGMDFVLMHAETTACIAASTYGLLRGQPGAATVTRGPGAAAAVNGAAQATFDRSPLLLVSDVVPAEQAPRVPHQRIDQPALFAPVTKHSATIGSGDADAVARAAVALAMQPPMGAVHLDVDPTAASGPLPIVTQLPEVADDAAVERAAGLLAGRTRPVMLLGAEAWPWVDAVRAFAEAVGCPAFTTYQARGLVPDDSAHAAGVFTNGALERPLLDGADLVLAVGLDPVEPIPAAWNFGADVVSLMPWPIRDRYYEPAVEVVGPIGPVLDRLAPVAVADGWEDGAARRARDEARARLRAQRSHHLDPVDVVDALTRGLPDDADVTVDAGAHMLAVVPLLDVTRPRGMLISNGLATMGFAIPAAVGAALASPGRSVAALTGDGGLGMVLSDLETIARLELPVTVVVFDDAALSLIEIKQRDDHGGADAVRYHDIDFAGVARSMGLASARISDRQDLDAALGGDWHRPRLLDVRIDPAPYRHIIGVTRG